MNKEFADRRLERTLRDAGARVSTMWEVRGPKNTDVAWITCYQVGHSICIVETFKTGGFTALTPNSSSHINDVVGDVLKRCGVEVSASARD